ncbi:MAG TPA: glycosyltransferase family 39 protein [Acidimicrobiales bacterium]|nr:glycosyltransferase family 39 protein [Acidimicrobiales bacterium]
MSRARALRAGLERWDATPVVVIAAAVVAFHAVLSGRYGFHRDELYYLAAGRRPAWGYVDQPPVVPLLARVIAVVAGEHLWPLRLVAGAVHAGVVVLAALVARELGGDRRATVLAAVATATAPLFVATGSLFQTVPFDQLAWALVWVLVVRLLRGADARWWLAVGAVFGLGLETKWTITLLGGGLAVGFIAVPDARHHLRSVWPWAGLAVALALWLPNLLWQAFNDWPTLEFARNNNADVRAEDGRLGFLAQQVALVGPLALPLAAGGLIWMWRRRPWRVLAIAVAAVAVVQFALGAKAYYLGPVYPLAFAAGGVAAKGWVAGAERRWRWALGALLLNGIIALPAVAPVAPVDLYAEVFHDVNDELGEEVGWPDMADQVAAVMHILPADEQSEARVITASYGEAAAIDLYGPARDMPRGTALSAHNSYADWWPDGEPAGTVVTVGYPLHLLDRYCDALGPAAIVSNPWDVSNDVAGTPILVCRDLRVSPEGLRRALQHYE